MSHPPNKIEHDSQPVTEVNQLKDKVEGWEERFDEEFGELEEMKAWGTKKRLTDFIANLLSLQRKEDAEKVIKYSQSQISTEMRIHLEKLARSIESNQ